MKNFLSKIQLKKLWLNVKSAAVYFFGLVQTAAFVVGRAAKKTGETCVWAYKTIRTEGFKSLFKKKIQLNFFRIEQWRKPDVAIVWLTNLRKAVHVAVGIIIFLGLIYFAVNLIWGYGSGRAEAQDRETAKQTPENSPKNSKFSLVDLARAYSEHLGGAGKPKNQASIPSKPPITTPGGPAKPVQPTVLKPKIGAPSFTLQGTLELGNNEGLAWVLLPGKIESEAFAKGDKIDQYTLVEVSYGHIVVERDGATYTVKVPEPSPELASAPSMTHPVSSNVPSVAASPPGESQPKPTGLRSLRRRPSRFRR